MPKNYINKAAFTELFKKKIVNRDKIMEGCALMIEEIGHRFRYEVCQEAKSEIYITCMLKYKKFDFKKSSDAFSYITTIIWNGYLQALRREKYDKNKLERYQRYQQDRYGESLNLR